MTRPILYHCPDARSLRCLWAVEEAGIDVDLRLLKFPPRAFEPDYRAVNPLMTIPGWVEDGRLMTESAAICERIARAFSRATASVTSSKLPRPISRRRPAMVTRRIHDRESLLRTCNMRPGAPPTAYMPGAFRRLT